MRLRIAIFLAAQFSALLAAEIDAQEVPVLLETVGRTTCSEIRGETDAFLRDLALHTSDSGVVLNRGGRNDKVGLIYREEKIKAQIALRRFDLSRVQFHRAFYSGDVETQFWKIRGSSKLTAQNQDDTYLLPDVRKPMLLFKGDEYDESECYDIDELAVLAKILKGNAGSMSNVLFYPATARDAKVREGNVRKVLSKNGINLNRVRFSARIERRGANQPKPTEYWYLPSRN